MSSVKKTLAPIQFTLATMGKFSRHEAGV